MEIESHAAVLSIEDSMAELQRLADTAGAAVIGMCIQRRGKPDAAFFLGRGKVEELSLAIQQTGATMVILMMNLRRRSRGTSHWLWEARSLTAQH